MKSVLFGLAAASLFGASASAVISVSTYDDLPEGFLGETTSYNGVTYSNVNNVPGMFPDGSTFEAGDGINGLGNNLIIENATLLYNDFPGYGSPNNSLTFGTSFIPGDNLSLGALSTVTMDLDDPADSAMVDLAYFENGPWGGIVLHLDAFSNGSLVDSDSFTLSDLGGRDNVAINTLSVGGGQFDSLQLYATFGASFSGPRVLIDNLTLNTVPTPGAVALLGLGGLASTKRRR